MGGGGSGFGPGRPGGVGECSGLGEFGAGSGCPGEGEYSGASEFETASRYSEGSGLGRYRGGGVWGWEGVVDPSDASGDPRWEGRVRGEAPFEGRRESDAGNLAKVRLSSHGGLPSCHGEPRGVIVWPLARSNLQRRMKLEHRRWNRIEGRTW